MGFQGVAAQSLLDETFVDEPLVDESWVDENWVDEGPQSVCCHSRRSFWTTRFDGVLWWPGGGRLPTLLTGTPGTNVLFGNEEVNKDARGGVRFTLGKSISKGIDLEASYLI